MEEFIDFPFTKSLAEGSEDELDELAHPWKKKEYQYTICRQINPLWHKDVLRRIIWKWIQRSDKQVNQ